jgi:Stress responsive A/B Barrel Domain
MPTVKHVALLRFKPQTPTAKIKEIFSALDDLRHKIPGLLDFSGGPYSSQEGLNQGFTHGFIMTFADAASRDAYLPHPDHEAVKEQIVPWLDGGLAGVIAFDWLS